MTSNSATSWRPTYLVLDSTELCRDWLLRGLAFRAMRHIRNGTGMTVAIPAPVLEEVHANHARASAEAKRAVRRGAKSFRQLGLPGHSELETAASSDGNYPEQLARALELLEIEVLPWPIALHEEVVTRAVTRRRPFNTNGGGYRDTLVWLSALALAEKGCRVILASRDNIFADSSGALHKTLASEVAAAEGGSIELARNLDQWVVGEIPWSEGVPLTELAGDARDDRFFEFLMQWGFEDLQIDDLELGLPGSASDVDLDSVDGESDVNRAEVKRLADGGTFVEYRVKLHLWLNAEMSAQDAAAMGLAFNNGPDAAGRVSVSPRVDAVAVFGVLYDEYDLLSDVATLALEKDGATVVRRDNQQDYSQLVLWDESAGAASLPSNLAPEGPD